MLKKKLFGLLVCAAPLVSLTSYGAGKHQQHQGDVEEDIFVTQRNECIAHQNDPAGQLDPNFTVKLTCDARRLELTGLEHHKVKLPGEATQAISFKVKCSEHIFDPYAVVPPQTEATCVTGTVIAAKPKLPISVDLTCDQINRVDAIAACNAEFQRVCPEAGVPEDAAQQVAQEVAEASSSDGKAPVQHSKGKKGAGFSCDRTEVVAAVDTCGFYK